MVLLELNYKTIAWKYHLNDVEVILYKIEKPVFETKRSNFEIKTGTYAWVLVLFYSMLLFKKLLNFFKKGPFLKMKRSHFWNLKSTFFGTFLNQKGTFFRPKVPFSLILLLKKVPVRDLFPRLKNDVPIFF